MTTGETYGAGDQNQEITSLGSLREKKPAAPLPSVDSLFGPLGLHTYQNLDEALSALAENLAKDDNFSVIETTLTQGTPDDTARMILVRLRVVTSLIQDGNIQEAINIMRRLLSHQATANEAYVNLFAINIQNLVDDYSENTSPIDESATDIDSSTIDARKDKDKGQSNPKGGVIASLWGAIRKPFNRTPPQPTTSPEEEAAAVEAARLAQEAADLRAAQIEAGKQFLENPTRLLDPQDTEYMLMAFQPDMVDVDHADKRAEQLQRVHDIGAHLQAVFAWNEKMQDIDQEYARFMEEMNPQLAAQALQRLAGKYKREANLTPADRASTRAQRLADARQASNLAEKYQDRNFDAQLLLIDAKLDAMAALPALAVYADALREKVSQDVADQISNNETPHISSRFFYEASALIISHEMELLIEELNRFRPMLAQEHAITTETIFNPQQVLWEETKHVASPPKPVAPAVGLFKFGFGRHKGQDEPTVLDQVVKVRLSDLVANVDEFLQCFANDGKDYLTANTDSSPAQDDKGDRLLRVAVTMQRKLEESVATISKYTQSQEVAIHHENARQDLANDLLANVALLDLPHPDTTDQAIKDNAEKVRDTSLAVLLDLIAKDNTAKKHKKRILPNELKNTSVIVEYEMANRDVIEGRPSDPTACDALFVVDFDHADVKAAIRSIMEKLTASTLELRVDTALYEGVAKSFWSMYKKLMNNENKKVYGKNLRLTYHAIPDNALEQSGATNPYAEGNQPLLLLDALIAGTLYYDSLTPSKKIALDGLRAKWEQVRRAIDSDYSANALKNSPSYQRQLEIYTCLVDRQHAMASNLPTDTKEVIEDMREMENSLAALAADNDSKKIDSIYRAISAPEKKLLDLLASDDHVLLAIADAAIATKQVTPDIRFARDTIMPNVSLLLATAWDTAREDRLSQSSPSPSTLDKYPSKIPAFVMGNQASSVVQAALDRALSVL